MINYVSVLIFNAIDNIELWVVIIVATVLALLLFYFRNKLSNYFKKKKGTKLREIQKNNFKNNPMQKWIKEEIARREGNLKTTREKKITSQNVDELGNSHKKKQLKNISTIKELQRYFKQKQIVVFKSKSPGVSYMRGRHATLIKKVNEIQQKGHEVWESEYRGKWNTFIKDPLEFIERNNNRQNYNDFEEDYEDPRDLEMQAYEYDGDPDKFDEWREANGY